MPKRRRSEPSAGADVVRRSFAARPHLPRMDHATDLAAGLQGVLVSCLMKKEISGLHETLSLLERAHAAQRGLDPTPSPAAQDGTASPDLQGGPPSGSSSGAPPSGSSSGAAEAKEARLEMDSSFPAVPCKTGCSGLLFLRFHTSEAAGQVGLPDPVALLQSALGLLAAGSLQRPTFLQRIFPVQTTTPPTLEAIVPALRRLLSCAAKDPATAEVSNDLLVRHSCAGSLAKPPARVVARRQLFSPTSTYWIMYKSRGASSVERGALFTAAGALLQEEGHRCGGGVSIAAPDVALLCQMVSRTILAGHLGCILLKMAAISCADRGSSSPRPSSTTPAAPTAPSPSTATASSRCARCDLSPRASC